MTSVIHTEPQPSSDRNVIAPVPAHRSEAALSSTSAILTFGHLAWLAWVWAGAAVVYAGIVTVLAVVGDGATTGLWNGVGAGWQRWLVLAAGCSTPWTFLAPFVANGVSRRRFSTSTVVAMGVVSACGAAFAVAGFLVERPLYDALGWEVSSGVISERHPLLLLLHFGLTYATYFVSGWLIGTAFYRFDVLPAILAIVPCSLPVVAAELLGSGVGDLTLFPELDDLPAAVALAGMALVVSAAALVATRVTARTPVRSP